MLRRLSITILLLGFAGAIVAQPANAQTFNGSYFDGTTGKTDLAAANFFIGTSATQTAGTCTLGFFCVTVQNKSTFSAFGNNDLMTGFEFSADFTFSSTPAITTLTATSAVASSVLNTSGCSITCTGSNLSVTDYWGATYSASGSNAAPTATGIPAVNHPVYVLNTSGFANLYDYSQKTKIISAKNSINCTSPLYDGSCGSNQPDWSIVSKTATSSGNSGPVIMDNITFGFLMPTNVTSLKISNVYFLYGTNPDGSSVASAPEPSTFAILASGVVGFTAIRRRRAAT